MNPEHTVLVSWHELKIIDLGLSNVSTSGEYQNARRILTKTQQRAILTAQPEAPHGPV